MDERRILVAKAAYLKALGYSPLAIQKLLDRKQVVYDYLRDAQQLEILSEHFVAKAPEDREAIRQLNVLEQETDDPVRDALAARTVRAEREEVLKRVRVLPLNCKSALDERDRARFARGAAARLTDMLLLHKPQVLGCSWGATLAAVARNLAGTGWRHPWPSRQAEVCFLPTAGEPFDQVYDDPTASESSTHIAQLLHATILRRDKPLSLSGIPAFLPRHGRSRHTLLFELLQHSESYRRIFPERTNGDADGNSDEAVESPHLINSMTLMLTGVSRDLRPLGSAGDQFLKQVGVTRKELDSLPLSDMAGVPILRCDRTDPRYAACRSFIQKWTAMWTGVTRPQLERCARRPDRAPGVVMLAFGPERVQSVIHAAGDAGMVNELYCDQSLARALREALHVKGPPPDAEASDPR